MKGYLSIGKVSKLKNVSIKSLRYYDRIGVFSPAYINQQTNYRYYTEDQLYLLDAITLCIELGIPLSSFDTYKEGDSVNMQKLLFDAKDLAEQKIRSMQNAIGRLQVTLNSLEEGTPAEKSAKDTSVEQKKKTAPAEKKAKDTAGKQEKKTAPAEKKADNTTPLPERKVLLIPFDEVTTAQRYNHMLLSLFVNAERCGCSAGYPTGLVYEDLGEGMQKYVFVTLSDAGSLSEENQPAEETGCRFKRLPAGDYFTRRSTEHSIEKAGEIFPEAETQKSKGTLLLVETDVLEEKGTKELQLWIG